MIFEGRGELRIKTAFSTIIFKNTLYVSLLKINFFSVIKRIENNAEIKFTKNSTIIKNKTISIQANKINNLYVFENIKERQKEFNFSFGSDM